MTMNTRPPLPNIASTLLLLLLLVECLLLPPLTVSGVRADVVGEQDEMDSYSHPLVNLDRPLRSLPPQQQRRSGPTAQQADGAPATFVRSFSFSPKDFNMGGLERRSPPAATAAKGRPVKMHNLLGGNILVQQAESSARTSPYMSSWDMGGRAKPITMPRPAGYRLAQESISSAIKKILMGIH